MEKVLSKCTKESVDKAVRERIGRGKEWNTIDALIDHGEQLLREHAEHVAMFGGPIGLEIEYLKKLKNEHDREVGCQLNAEAADFLMKHYSHRITEGNVGEVVIKILKEQKHFIESRLIGSGPVVDIKIAQAWEDVERLQSALTAALENLRKAGG